MRLETEEPFVRARLSGPEIGAQMAALTARKSDRTHTNLGGDRPRGTLGSRCVPQSQTCNTHPEGEGRQSHTPLLLPKMFKKAVHEHGEAGLRTLGSLSHSTYATSV